MQLKKGPLRLTAIPVRSSTNLTRERTAARACPPRAAASRGGWAGFRERCCALACGIAKRLPWFCR